MIHRDDEEHSVPKPWRAKFRKIAEAFAAGDLQLCDAQVDGVEPIDRATADSIAANVASYEDQLAPLNEATWNRSVCRWMGDYWLVLVDLTTAKEAVSDLTLQAKVYDESGRHIKIESVHVP